MKYQDQIWWSIVKTFLLFQIVVLFFYSVAFWAALPTGPLPTADCISVFVLLSVFLSESVVMLSARVIQGYGTGKPPSWAVMSAINIKRIHRTQLSTGMIRLWRKNDVTGIFLASHHQYHQQSVIIHIINSVGIKNSCTQSESDIKEFFLHKIVIYREW